MEETVCVHLPVCVCVFVGGSVWVYAWVWMMYNDIFLFLYQLFLQPLKLSITNTATNKLLPTNLFFFFSDLENALRLLSRSDTPFLTSPSDSSPPSLLSGRRRLTAVARSEDDDASVGVVVLWVVVVYGCGGFVGVVVMVCGWFWRWFCGWLWWWFCGWLWWWFCLSCGDGFVGVMVMVLWRSCRDFFGFVVIF